MTFKVPRNDPSEMVLYMWKIFDLPKISKEDLLYNISFDLFLFSPQKARKFLEKAIENGYLKIDDQQVIKLSNDLRKNLDEWQRLRRSQIMEKMGLLNQQQNSVRRFNQGNQSDFNTLLKAFLDKGTINRAVTVSDSAIEIIEYDFNEGILKAKIKGSKDLPYYVNINLKNCELKHNCHDFSERRSKNKKFCKHLAKLFLSLKEQDDSSATKFLNKIAEKINEIEFVD